MKLIQIAACSENRVIGTENKLPWDIPEDLKFFRTTTKGHILILGRKTFDSIGAKPLPHRFHIVISRNSAPASPTMDRVLFVKDVETAISAARNELRTGKWGDEVYVAGGGEIYRQTLSYCDLIYLTLIHKTFEGDAHFPELDEQKFELFEKLDRSEPIPFSFLKYRRKKAQQSYE